MRTTVATLCSFLVAVSSFADSYQITIPDGGIVAIANHLNHGGNTMNELFPNMVEGSYLLKWDCASEAYIGASSCTAPGHWSPNITLVPGEGALLANNDVIPVTVTFTGTPQTPVLPPALSCGCGHAYLLSSQTATIGTWNSIVGAAPAEGSLFAKFDSVFYVWVTNGFFGCQWTNGVPTASVGESVLLYVPCATNNCPCTNLTFTCSVNKTQECGTAWTFDPPTGVSACCGTGATVSVTSTVTNGLCPQTATQTWLIQDSCGNSSTCSQTVTVVNTTPPVLNGPGFSGCVGNQGTNFWLAFPANYFTFGTPINLYIVAAAGSSGTVSMPGVGFSTSFSISPGGIATILLPLAAMLTSSDSVENKGIHVTSLNNVAVYGSDQESATTDAYLALPVEQLGADYLVLSYQNSGTSYPPGGTEFAIVATEDATTVTITPTVTVGARLAGAAYTISLNQGQTYQLQKTGFAPNDLSGTSVAANKPIAVFGANQCADIPNGNVGLCDHIVEQLLPTTAWGREFYTMPLQTRAGDTFRVLASVNGTTVKVNNLTVATLNRGQFYQQLITAPASISADQPVLVAQYANGSGFDNVQSSDPSMMLLQAKDQYMTDCSFAVPVGLWSGEPATNFINVVTPNSAVGLVTLDGIAIPAGSFTAIGVSGYSGTQRLVTEGPHRLLGPAPFGLAVYGFSGADAYSYPGGFCLGPQSPTADKTVDCAMAWTFDTPTATDACCGTNVGVAVLSTVTNGSCPQIITQIWQATDCCANTVTYTQTVTVVTLPAVILCADAKAVPVGQTWHFDPPTLRNGCCNNPTITLLSSNLLSSSDCQTVFSGIWQIVDCCDHVSTCTQLVTVQYTAPVFSSSPSASNLVPNPGFETYSACPDYLSQISLAVPWFQPSLGTSDFFQTCNASGSPAHVPENAFGTQSPHGGNGYAGFYAYFETPSGNPAFGLQYREYVETPLSAPLVAGHTYEISFYVSLADHSTFAVDNIGAFLSVGPSPSGGFTAPMLDAQVRNPVGVPLTSKTDWMLVKGWYTALHNEDHLTIGNFKDDSGTGSVPVAGGEAEGLVHDFAYYYLDDVSVIETVAACGADKTVEYGTSWGFDRPVVFDSSCTNITITLLSSNLISITPPCQSVFQGIWQGTDCCSNTATCTQTVTLVDTIAPSLCCPTDITVYTCSNQAQVKWTVKVTDNLSAGLQATCTPPSGSIFPVGTTTVSCTATDACGNVGSCSFKVIVVGNHLLTVTKTLGINDCYKPGNETAPVPKSTTLTAGLPGSWKLFDESTPGKRFGASFMGLSNDIQCAQLWIRMKPNCLRNISQDDTLSLGFTNYPPGPAKAAWTNYLGGGNSTPGLINNVWCQLPDCAYLFSLNLANLPQGGANLLPLINRQHRLDLLVENSTTVDYCQLCYCYCPGKPLWQGLEWNLANASFIRNCAETLMVSRDVFTNFTVGASPGEMRGISFTLSPLSLANPAANSSLIVTGQRTVDEQHDSLRISGHGGSVTTFDLASLRTNVTQLKVMVRNGTNIVSQSNLPLTPGANLLTVTGAPLLTGIGSASAGNSYQISFEAAHPVATLAGVPVSGDSVEFVTVAPSSSGDNLLASLTLEVAGLDQIEVTDVLLQAGRQTTRIEGEAVAALAGDVLSISSLALETNNPVGFTTGLGAGASRTDPIWVQPVGTLCQSSVVTPRLTGTAYGLFANEAAPARVGNVTFAPDTNGWSITGDFANLRATGTRFQVINQGTMVADTGDLAVGSADAPDLPNQWSLSATPSAGLFIFTWPETEMFTVNGNLYFGDELRLLPLGTNLLTFSLASLSVHAVGMESLMLATDATGPIWTLYTPAVSATQMLIQWDGPSGGTLESSPTVLGPWTIVPDQSGNAVILGSPLTNSQPAQFFRVRSQP